MIIPRVFPTVQNARYDYKILDMRGLVAVTDGEVQIAGDFNANNLPPFDHPDPVIANITGLNSVIINAQPQQITSQRSVGVEISRDGAASAFVTLTIEANNTTA